MGFRIPAHLIRALRHRNYKLFFSGQLVSLLGTWITRLATSWLVYRLTKSELMLGFVAFAGQIPMLLLGPYAGVIADRWNKHRLLVGTQVLSALQSVVLAWLALTGIITVTHVILLQVLQGVINAFDTPARQALVVDMVEDRSDLPNAIALNSAMFNGSRIAGPTVAGVLIAAVGEGWCFAIDAVTYLGVIISLLAMRLPRTERRTGGASVLDELKTGFRYASRFAPVRALLLQVAIVSIMGMPYVTLMPVIAAQTLHGGASTLGMLMTFSGVGALIGTIYLAARHTVVGLGKVIIAATAALSLGLIAFSFSNSLGLSAVALAFVGAGMMLQSSSANTILQTIVDEDLRGRVMGFYTMAILGTQPIGSLVAGFLADRIGAQHTILIGAIACVAGGAWFAFERPALAKLVKPIYAELGIITTDSGTIEPLDGTRIR